MKEYVLEDWLQILVESIPVCTKAVLVVYGGTNILLKLFTLDFHAFVHIQISI